MTGVNQEELKQLLYYDEKIGRFIRVLSKGRAKVGDIAGTLNQNGYRSVQVNGKPCQEHCLVWLYTYGAFPKGLIDHVDCDKSNNRLENLRESSNAENQRNRGKNSNNTSGYKGVVWCKRTRKWKAQICTDGKTKSIGRCVSKEEAYHARCLAAKELHKEFNNNG